MSCKKIGFLCSRSRSQERSKFQRLCEWYLVNCWTLSNQTWFDDSTSWARVSHQKIGLLPSQLRSQGGLIQSGMTVSAIPTEPQILLQPKLIGWYITVSPTVSCKDYCGQGLGHSEGSKLDWIFVNPVFSVQLISLQPNLVCWCTNANKRKWSYTDMDSNCYNITVLTLTVTLSQYH